MKKELIFGDVRIPATEFAAEGNAMLGIKKSGKSYTATMAAEQLLEIGIPFIAYDPINIWHNLRVPGKGRGYPVVVASAEHGDIPLTVESAPDIVRAAMRENISLVFDLYSAKFTTADWRRIVADTVRILLHENKEHGLRHIFLEEAAEFIPQVIRPAQTTVYDAVESLARMGGNASLGFTLINPRSQSVNKAVLEMCDCLFLFRQRGSNSIQALEKWMDYLDKDMSKNLVSSISNLKAGECWLWAPGQDVPTLQQMQIKNSFHPDREHPTPPKSKKATDVSSFIVNLKGSLAKHLEKAKLEDPKELRKVIADLQKQIAKLSTGKPAPAAKAPRPMPAPVIKTLSDAQVARLEKQVERLVATQIEVDGHCTQVTLHVNKLLEQVKRPVPTVAVAPALTQTRSEQLRTAMLPQSGAQQVWNDAHVAKTAHSVQPTHFKQGAPTTAGDVELSKVDRELLAVLANFPEGCNRKKLLLLAGYHWGGYTSDALGRLRSAGAITGGNGDTMRITDKGAGYGPFSTIPSGRERLQYWINFRQFSGAAKKILIALSAYPEGLSKDDLMGKIGMAWGGYTSDALGALRTAGVIVGKNSEIIKISDELLVD